MNLRKFHIEALAVGLLFIFTMILGGCVDVETDPEPPYPVDPYDYTEPESQEQDAPWLRDDIPMVSITQPNDGQFVTAGDVAVVGTYAGPALDALTVNGEPVSLTDGAFSTTLTIADGQLLTDITVSAKDETGIIYSDNVTVVNGTANSATGIVDDSFLIDIENTGFAAVSSLASNLLDGTEITTSLQKELVPEKALFEVSSAVIGNFDLAIASYNEGLKTDILLSGIVLNMKLLGLPASLTLDGLFISATSAFDVTGTHNIQLEIVDSEVGLASWNTDLPILPEAIEGILDFVLELVVPPVVNIVVGMVDDLLNGLLANLELNITGDNFVYALLPSLADTTNRNFELGFDTDVDKSGDWNEDFQPEGYLVTDSDIAEFTGKGPKSENEYGIALALQDDMLNQLFYMLAASGTLDISLTIDGFTAEAMSLLFSSFKWIPADYPVYFEFKPSVAPVVWADTETETMYLTIPAFIGRTIVDRSAEELDPYEAMTFAVDVVAPLDIEIIEPHSIGLRLGALDISVRNLHNAVGQSNTENMDRIFTELFDNVLPELLTQLESSLQIEIPQLSGLQIDLADIAAFGPGTDYWGIFLSLEYLP